MEPTVCPKKVFCSISYFGINNHFEEGAVLQTVSVIFEDPGVQDLLVKLYQKGTSIAALSVFSFSFGCLVSEVNRS